jgi:hypothetical protein
MTSDGYMGIPHPLRQMQKPFVVPTERGKPLNFSCARVLQGLEVHVIEG